MGNITMRIQPFCKKRVNWAKQRELNRTLCVQVKGANFARRICHAMRMVIVPTFPKGNL